MIFIQTELMGAYVIELEKKIDQRGFFARSWDSQQFKEHGLNSQMAQCNISFSKEKGTLRGMHYQEEPYAESKLIRCTRGKIYDVIIDLRHDSKTFRKWIGVELSAENYKILYVPEGFAHGFLSLEDNTEIFYQVSQFYSPTHERGVRWNDPVFSINWPIEVKVISDKDSSWKSYEK